jgi:hypothetical protein
MPQMMAVMAKPVKNESGNKPPHMKHTPVEALI